MMMLLKEVSVAYIITEDCINRGGRIDECPEGAIIEGDEKSSIDPDKGTDCGICVNEFFCPSQAIIPG
jgi:ferredoxin